MNETERKWIPWAGIEASPEYQSADDELKRDTLLNWRDHTLRERNASAEWDPASFMEFELFVESKRRQLAGAAPESSDPATIFAEMQDEQDRTSEQLGLLFKEADRVKGAEDMAQFAKTKVIGEKVGAFAGKAMLGVGGLVSSMWDLLGKETWQLTPEETERIQKAKQEFEAIEADSDERLKGEIGSGAVFQRKFAEKVNEVMEGKKDAGVVLGRPFLNPKFYRENDRGGAVKALQEAGATEDEIALALAQFEIQRENIAEAEVKNLSEMTFSGAPKFDEWRATEAADLGTADAVAKFREQFPGAMKRKQLSKGFQIGAEDIADQIAALPLLSMEDEKAQRWFGTDFQQYFSKATEKKEQLRAQAAAAGQDTFLGVGLTDLSAGATSLLPTVASTAVTGGGTALLRGTVGVAASKAAKSLATGAIRNSVLRNAAIRAGGGLGKALNSKEFSKMFTQAGMLVTGGIQGAGGSAYEAYLNRRELLASQGLSGEALESTAREAAMGDALRAGAVTAGIIAVTGLKGAEAMGRVAVAANNPGARTAFVGKMKKVLSDTYEEAGEEALDTALNSALDGLTNNPHWTFNEFVSEVAMAGKLGAILGGGVGAVSTTAEAFLERSAREAADAAAADPAIAAARASAAAAAPLAPQTAAAAGAAVEAAANARVAAAVEAAGAEAEAAKLSETTPELDPDEFDLDENSTEEEVAAAERIALALTDFETKVFDSTVATGESPDLDAFRQEAMGNSALDGATPEQIDEAANRALTRAREKIRQAAEAAGEDPEAAVAKVATNVGTLVDDIPAESEEAPQATGTLVDDIPAEGEGAVPTPGVLVDDIPATPTELDEELGRVMEAVASGGVEAAEAVIEQLPEAQQEEARTMVSQFVPPEATPKAEPTTFRDLVGRQVTVDGEGGELRVDEEDGTVLLEREGQPPIIVSRDADSPFTKSEFAIRIDEEMERDIEQGAALRRSIGGRPTARPIERPAPRTTFVREDGAIVTGSTVAQFVAEGETEAGDLFVTVRDEAGNQFELHGDDALAVAIARRNVTRDVELDIAVSEAVEQASGPTLDFDRVLTRLIGPKTALLEVTTRDSRTAGQISRDTVDRALEELTELENQIQNENFPDDIRASLLGILNEAFDDVAQVSQRVPRAAAENTPTTGATPADGANPVAQPALQAAEVASPEAQPEAAPEQTPEERLAARRNAAEVAIGKGEREDTPTRLTYSNGNRIPLGNAIRLARMYEATGELEQASQFRAAVDEVLNAEEKAPEPAPSPPPAPTPVAGKNREVLAGRGGRYQSLVDSHGDLLDRLERLGVEVEVADDAATYAGISGKRKGAAVTLTSGGTSKVVLFDKQLRERDGKRDSKKSAEKLADTLFHEAAHAAQRVFASRPGNETVIDDATGAFDKNSPDYDAELDAFMRREYRNFAKLEPRQKVAEATRAIVEGEYRGKTSSGGFGRYLKQFLSFIREMLVETDESPIMRLVRGIETELGLDQIPDQAVETRTVKLTASQKESVLKSLPKNSPLRKPVKAAAPGATLTLPVAEAAALSEVLSKLAGEAKNPIARNSFQTKANSLAATQPPAPPSGEAPSGPAPTPPTRAEATETEAPAPQAEESAAATPPPTPEAPTPKAELQSRIDQARQAWESVRGVSFDLNDPDYLSDPDREMLEGTELDLDQKATLEAASEDIAAAFPDAPAALAAIPESSAELLSWLDDFESWLDAQQAQADETPDTPAAAPAAGEAPAPIALTDAQTQLLDDAESVMTEVAESLPKALKSIPRKADQLPGFRDKLEARLEKMREKVDRRLERSRDADAEVERMLDEIAAVEEALASIELVIEQQVAAGGLPDTAVSAQPATTAQAATETEAEADGDEEVDVTDETIPAGANEAELDNEADLDDADWEAAVATGQPITVVASGRRVPNVTAVNQATLDEESASEQVRDAIPDPTEDRMSVESRLAETIREAELDRHDPRTALRVRKSRKRRFRGRRNLSPEERTEVYRELHAGSSSKQLGVILGAVLRGVAATTGAPLQALANRLSIVRNGAPTTGDLLQQGPKPTPTEVQSQISRTNFVTTETMAAALGGSPEYHDSVISFLRGQREKLQSGKLTAKDLAKAHYLASADRNGRPVSLATFQAKFPNFTGEGTQRAFISADDAGNLIIRPEDGAAWWLSTPLGQAALDLVAAGDYRESVWRQGARVHATFTGAAEETAGPAPVVVPAAGGQISQSSDAADHLRVGTAKLGTDKKPANTPQTSNVSPKNVPPKLLAKQLAKVNYSHLPKGILDEVDPERKRRKLIAWFKGNLLALHDAFPPEHRARATRWYDGANRIANNFAARFGATAQQMAGVIAVFSPQKDWFMNVAQAEQFAEIWKDNQDVVITRELFGEVVEQIIAAAQAPDRAKRKKVPGETAEQTEERRAYNAALDQKAKDDRREILSHIFGKSIRDLDNRPVLQGWAIRTLAQQKFGREFQTLSPEGDKLGRALKNDGTPTTNTWGSVNEIIKAVRIMKDGSLESISENLGREHKVRNFYNNIIAPNSPNGDATIDTHAVAAAHLLPFGSSATEVNHNFGTGMSGSKAIGVSGIYHIYLEAYREAAAERGLLPRQMQSITWEAIRLLYPAEEKSKAQVAEGRKTWKTLSNERAQFVLVHGKGSIPSPVWARTNAGGQLGGDTGDVSGGGGGDVAGGGLRVRDRGTSRARRGKQNRVTGPLFGLAEIRKLTNAVNNAKGDPQALAKVTASIPGLEGSGAPFLNFLLGFGSDINIGSAELETWLVTGTDPRAARRESLSRLDAAEYNLRTSRNPEATPAPKLVMVKRLQRRIRDLMRERPNGVPDPDEEFYLHAVQRWIANRAAHPGIRTGEAAVAEFAQQLSGTGNVVQGFLRRLSDGRAVLAALRGSNESTALHEFAHFIRPNLSEAHQKNLESAYKVKGGEWTVAQEEKFARDFERYVRDGKLPKTIITQIKEAFEALSRIMRHIYKVLRGSPLQRDIHPKVRQVFDELFIAGGAPALRAVGEPRLLDRMAAKSSDLQLGDRIRYHNKTTDVEGAITEITPTDDGKRRVVVTSMSDDFERVLELDDNDTGSLEIVDRTDKVLLEVPTEIDEAGLAEAQSVAALRDARLARHRVRLEDIRKQREDYINANAAEILDENGNIRQRQVETNAAGEVTRVIDSGLPARHQEMLSELTRMAAEEDASMSETFRDPKALAALRNVETYRLTRITNDLGMPTWARAIARKLIYTGATSPDIPPALETRIRRETTALLRTEFPDITDAEVAKLTPLLRQAVLRVAQSTDGTLTLNEALSTELDWGALATARTMEIRDVMREYGRVTARAANIEAAADFGFVPSRMEVDEAIAEIRNPWPQNIRTAFAEARRAAREGDAELPPWMQPGGGIFRGMGAEEWTRAKTTRGVMDASVVVDYLGDVRGRDIEVLVKFYDDFPVAENSDGQLLARNYSTRSIEAAWDRDGNLIWPVSDGGTGEPAPRPKPVATPAPRPAQRPAPQPVLEATGPSLAELEALIKDSSEGVPTFEIINTRTGEIVVAAGVKLTPARTARALKALRQEGAFPPVEIITRGPGAPALEPETLTEEAPAVTPAPTPEVAPVEAEVLSESDWKESLGSAIEESEAYMAQATVGKLVRVRDDGDLETSNIPGAHLFRTADGDIIAATKEDGQWNLESIYDGRVSTFDEGAINNPDALERLAGELAELRQQKLSEAVDRLIELSETVPGGYYNAVWASGLNSSENAADQYRFIDMVDLLVATKPDGPVAVISAPEVEVSPPSGPVSAEQLENENLLEQRAFYEGDEFAMARGLPPHFLEFQRPIGEISFKPMEGVRGEASWRTPLSMPSALGGRGLRKVDSALAMGKVGPLSGVFVDVENGRVVASDGEMAVQLPHRPEEGAESTVIDPAKGGQVVADSYPDTSAAFPTVPDDAYQDLGDGTRALQLASAAKHATELWGGSQSKTFDHFAVRIEFNGSELHLNPFHVSAGLLALQRAGFDMGALQIAVTPDNLVLIRPKIEPRAMVSIAPLALGSAADGHFATTTIFGAPSTAPAAVAFRPITPNVVRKVAAVGGTSHETAVRMLLDELVKRFPQLNFVVEDSLNLRNPDGSHEKFPALMQAMGRNTVRINLPRLIEATRGLYPHELVDVLQTLVTHEAVHEGAAKEFSEDELAKIGDDLTPDQRLAVARKYLSNQGLTGWALQQAAEEWSGVNRPVSDKARRFLHIRLAHEYLRQQYELATTGRTTEDVIAEVVHGGLMDRLLRYLRAALRRGMAMWRAYRDPALHVRMMRLHRAIAELTAGEEDLVGRLNPAGRPVFDEPLQLRNESMQQEFMPAALDWAKRTWPGVYANPRAGKYRSGGFLRAAFRWDQRLYDKLVTGQRAANSEEKRGSLAMANMNRALESAYGSDRTKWPIDAINAVLGNLDNRLNPRQVAQSKKIVRDARTVAARDLNAQFSFAAALDAAAAAGTPVTYRGRRISNPDLIRALATSLRAQARADYSNAIKAAKTRAQAFIKRSIAANQKLARKRQLDSRKLIDPKVLPYVDSLRDHIDELSRKVRDLTTISPELKAVVDNNLGLYLHRSYEIFDNPDYKEWVLERQRDIRRGVKTDPTVINVIARAEQWIKNNLVQQEAKRLMSAAGGGYPSTTAWAMARRNIGPDQVQQAFNDFISVADKGAKNYFEGVLTGNKPVSILMKRGDIPPEIQDLWGVYKDPTVNAAKTLASLAKFLNSNLFLQEVAATGIAEGWIVDEKDSLRPDGTQFVRLLPDDEMKYGPLAGKYGPPALRDALQSMTDGQNSRIWTFLQQVTGFSMMTKTAFSWMATARNWFGNILFMAANGNVGLSTWKNFNTAAVHVWGGNLSKGRLVSESSRLRVQERVARYVELGIVGSSTVSGLIEELLLSTDRVGAFNKLLKKNRLAKALTSFSHSVTNLYGSMDDFWKVIAFESELHQLRKVRAADLRNALSGVVDPVRRQEIIDEFNANLDVQAATIVRNTMPTYDMAPEIIKMLRRIPFVAPFVTFTSEVIRSTIGVAKHGAMHVAEGTTGLHYDNGKWAVDPARKNGKLTAYGLKRLVGLGFATSGIFALKGMIQAARGFDEEDEEDLRKHVAPWEENGFIVLVGREEDGSIKYFNGSYLNPYDYLVRPFRALVRDRPDVSWGERLTQSFGELAGPFVGEQIFFRSVVDSLAGVDKQGGKVWDQNDTPWQKLGASLGYIYEHAFEPGTFASVRRVANGLPTLWGEKGKVSPAGKEYRFGQEFVAALLGFKFQTADLNASMTFGSRKFAFDLRDANAEFTKPFKSPGTQGYREIVNAYDRMEEERKRAFLKLRAKYISALRLGGMSKADLRALMSTENVGSDDVKHIMRNTYERYEPESETLRDARLKGDRLGEDRIQAWRDAREKHERVQPLSLDDRES
jgi:hypothetical protein